MSCHADEPFMVATLGYKPEAARHHVLALNVDMAEALQKKVVWTDKPMPAEWTQKLGNPGVGGDASRRWRLGETGYI